LLVLQLELVIQSFRLEESAAKSRLDRLSRVIMSAEPFYRDC